MKIPYIQLFKNKIFSIIKVKKKTIWFRQHRPFVGILSTSDLSLHLPYFLWSQLYTFTDIFTKVKQKRFIDQQYFWDKTHTLIKIKK